MISLNIEGYFKNLRFVPMAKDEKRCRVIIFDNAQIFEFEYLVILVPPDGNKIFGDKPVFFPDPKADISNTPNWLNNDECILKISNEIKRLGVMDFK